MSKSWNIYRKNTDPDRNPVVTVHDLEYHGEWMEDEYVVLTVKSHTPIKFHFGDYLTYRGEQFVIDYNPNKIKKARKDSYGEAFVYENVKLFSLARELNDIAFKDYVLNWNSASNTNVYSSQGKFAFFAASVEDLADRLQANLDRATGTAWTVLTPNYNRTRQRINSHVPASAWLQYYHPGKSISEVDTNKTEGNRDINISVDNQSCRNILALAYKNFGLSFIVKNRVIIIGAPAVGANKVFKYGMGNGLSEIGENCDDSQTIVTKLYAYGSAQNLPTNYYANLHKQFYGVITEIHSQDPDRYHYAEFTLDIHYVAGLFNVRNMGPNNAAYQVGWTTKTSIDGIEIITKVENVSTDPWPMLRLYVEHREGDDETDEPNMEKLIAYIRNIAIGKHVVFTAGYDKNIWPQDHISYTNQERYPQLLSISNLMLPGFPDLSLHDWITRVANGSIRSASISQEMANTYLSMYDFSHEVMSPWIKSKKASTIGEKEGSIYFDGSSDDRPEIMPSIEGTGAGVVVSGSDIKDNGYLSEKVDTSFTIKVAASDILDWKEAWDSKQEEIYIEMKSGFCTGRKFKLQQMPKLENGSWTLKLERDQDSSLGRYFPYFENNTSRYSQVLSGDTFVVTGLQMPSSYVEAAAVQLLIKSCQTLDKIDEPKITYLPKVDEIFMANQDDEAKASDGTIISLHDTLMAGMCIHVEDEDLEMDLTTYIDSITIRENGNNGIPTYDVVLRDDKDVSDVQRAIDIMGGMSSLGEILSADEITRLIKQIGNANYLSKIREDETIYLIKFFGGIVADLMVQSPEFKLGEWTKEETELEDGTIITEDHNDGEGFSIWKNLVDDWLMEIDYATVRHLLRAKEIYTQTAHIDEVTNQTIFQVGLQTLGNILIGKYAEGVEGGIITPEGHVEIETLITRGLAKLQELFVVNNSTFGCDLSSIDFISAFLGGKGWAIQKKTRINSAGVEEEYFTLEIDNVTVRETLRVYEMIVSQLRGEFDNYVFAAMMEVHHYDPATGKVWLSTECGRIKAVPFRQGDYIKCQQYLAGNDVVSGGDGYITKSYELIVTDSGTGGMKDENGDRLDWITFKNFTTSIENGTPATVIAKKDTFVRLDNETNPERKGLMQIITVGPNTPYQDVYYGMKTDPNNALKLRLGNLSGVRTDLFGWLEEYGAYLPNLYAVGKMFNRQTGESYNSSLEIMRERMKSVYTETTYNIADEDNFLKNGFFARGLESWTVCTVSGGNPPSSVSQNTINSGDGSPLMVNGAMLSYQNRLTAEVTDYAGVKVLHLLGMGIYQNFSDITANGTHKENKSDNDQSDDYTKTKEVADVLYMGVRMIALSSGTLKVSFVQSNGSVIAEWSQTLNASREWQLIQAKDSDGNPWAYTGKSGKMIVSYTGECYIRFIALRTDPIVNSRETYETLFEQTSRRITLQAAKMTSDLNKAVAEINIEFDNIRQTVTNNKDAADRAFENIIRGLDDEIAARKNLEDTYHATWVYQNDHLLSLMAAEFDADGKIKGYADLKIQVGNISTTVTNNKTAADKAFKDLTDDLDLLSDDLDDEINNRQALENVYYGTWVYQNDHLLSLMAAEFDADGKIKGYADLKIQVGNISTTVTNNKTAADKAFESIGFTYKENTKKYDGTNYATWKKQTDERTGEWAAAFDANGKLKDYATTVQTAKDVSTRVGSITNAQFTSVLQKCGVISSSVTTYDQKLNDKEDRVNWDQVYSDFEQELDLDSVLSSYATVSSLNTLQNGISATVDRFEQTGVALNFQHLWDQGSTDGDSGETYEEAKSNSNYRIRTKNLYPCTTALRAYVKSGYNVDFVYFDKDRLCTGDDSGWQTPDSNGYVYPQYINSRVKYVALILRKNGDRLIAIPDAVSSGIRVSEDTLITYGEVSLLIEDGMSNFRVKADNVDFEFSNRWSVKAKNKGEVMSLDTDGNLYLAGTITGGNITGDVKVGTGTKFMKIVPHATGAYIVGYDNTYETLRLGFYNNDGTYVPSLFLHSKNGYNSQDSDIRIMTGNDFAEVMAESAGSTGAYHIIRMIAYPRHGWASIESNKWPTSKDATGLAYGGVYVDSSGYLRVKK